MARKTVDKEQITRARAALYQLQKDAARISDEARNRNDGMTREYFNGRWEGFDMANSLLRAIEEGRDPAEVYK